MVTLVHSDIYQDVEVVSAMEVSRIPRVRVLTNTRKMQFRSSAESNVKHTQDIIAKAKVVLNFY